MTMLVETPLNTYPMNIKAFMIVANAALTIMLISMIAMAGLESWQMRFGSRHFAKVVSILTAELEVTAGEDCGERRGCVSDDSTELTDA